MDDLAHCIGNWTDLPVVNRTALSELFTLNNTEGWFPMRQPPPPPNSTLDVKHFGFPAIFAVRRQLGLELNRQAFLRESFIWSAGFVYESQEVADRLPLIRICIGYSAGEMAH